MKDVIITGACRSGQRRVYSAFRKAKLKASYEKDAKDARLVVSWMLAVDVDSYLGHHAPYWDRTVAEVWHNTRHPLRCIPSMAARVPAALWVWQQPHTGLHPASPAFPNRRMFAANFWLKWNEEAENRKPAWQYRIEDLETVWPEMWERLDEPAPPFVDTEDYFRAKVDRRQNLEEPFEPMTYDEIKSWSPSVCDSVRRMAARYGYPDED